MILHSCHSNSGLVKDASVPISAFGPKRPKLENISLFHLPICSITKQKLTFFKQSQFYILYWRCTMWLTILAEERAAAADASECRLLWNGAIHRNPMNLLSFCKTKAEQQQIRGSPHIHVERNRLEAASFIICLSGFESQGKQFCCLIHKALSWSGTWLFSSLFSNWTFFVPSPWISLPWGSLSGANSPCRHCSLADESTPP